MASTDSEAEDLRLEDQSELLSYTLSRLNSLSPSGISNVNATKEDPVEYVSFKVIDIKTDSEEDGEGSSSTSDTFPLHIPVTPLTRVDPRVTRVSQVGQQAGFAPPMAISLPKDHRGREIEGGNPYPRPPQVSVPGSPFHQLSRLLQASFSPYAQKHHRDQPLPAILLTGQRGCGKRTSVLWAAHRMGIHVTELSMYELINEVESKSEVMLRARLEKSVADTAPGILLLRRLEALARKLPSSDAQQGRVPEYFFCLGYASLNSINRLLLIQASFSPFPSSVPPP